MCIGIRLPGRQRDGPSRNEKLIVPKRRNGIIFHDNDAKCKYILRFKAAGPELHKILDCYSIFSNELLLLAELLHIHTDGVTIITRFII